MRKQNLLTALLLIANTIFILSCQKQVVQESGQKEIVSSPNSGNGNNSKKIYVTDIAELYTAVNDPANAGNQIILSEGTYTLSSSYPNGGRLELQKDMELRGQPGHPELTVIDQTALPTASFNLSTGGRTGGIRMGRGSNVLEWLTIKGNVNALSAIDTDLPSTETYIKISHCIVSNSQIGIDIRNRLAQHSNRIIHASIENNEVVANNAGFGSGVVFQNANGVSSAVIIGDMATNYIHGNRVGFRAFNNAATSTVNDGSITVNSNADRIEGNGLAMYVAGGLSQASSALANGNQTHLEFHGTIIRNNNPAPMPPELLPLEASIPPGGIFAVGGISTVADNKASNNQFIVSFWGCDISGNNGTDINAFGAWSRTPVLLPGINNNAEIYLYGISTNANVVAIPCVPFEPAGTNVVNVVR